VPQQQPASQAALPSRHREPEPEPERQQPLPVWPHPLDPLD
jgi:HAE1 family hydrophobic/amphiphilic exporter-1